MDDASARLREFSLRKFGLNRVDRIDRIPTQAGQSLAYVRTPI